MAVRTLAVAVVGAVLAGAVLAVAAPHGEAAGQAGRGGDGRRDAGRDGPRVEDVTPWVAAGGEYAVRLRLPAGYPEARLRAEVFAAVDDGAEVRGLEGPGRRTRRGSVGVEVPAGAGTVTVHLPLGEGEGRLGLGPGVYPVLLTLDPEGGETWEAVTYLTRVGEASEATDVALVVPVSAEPSWTAGTGVTVEDSDVARVAELAAVLGAYPEVPVTLALEPALVAALPDTARGAAAREALAAAGRRGSVLHAPFADVAGGAWAGTPLDPHLVDQFAAGIATVTSFLGHPPDGATWLVDAGDSPILLRWLAARGVRRFLLTPHVPGGGLAGGRAPLRLAGLPGGHRAFAAATVDAPFPTTGEDPVLQANHLLAALHADAASRDGAPVVLLAPGPAGGDLVTLTALLRALSAGGPLSPAVASDLPVEAGDQVEVPTPPAPEADVASLLEDLSRLEGRLTSFATAVGGDDPEVAELGQAALVAGHPSVSDEDRARYLAEVEAAIAGSLAGIELADGGAMTITSHEAALPVTLRNTSGRTLDVAVTAESGQLTMLGDPVRATLPPGGTEDLEIPFRVSRSGDFAVRVAVATPDGGIVLASRVVSLRSTAVSGLGVVLSIGAVAFLALWWLRSARRRRHLPRTVATRSVPAHDARVREPVP